MKDKIKPKTIRGILEELVKLAYAPTSTPVSDEKLAQAEQQIKELVSEERVIKLLQIHLLPALIKRDLRGEKGSVFKKGTNLNKLAKEIVKLWR